MCMCVHKARSRFKMCQREENKFSQDVNERKKNGCLNCNFLNKSRHFQLELTLELVISKNHINLNCSQHKIRGEPALWIKLELCHHSNCLSGCIIHRRTTSETLAAVYVMSCGTVR